MYRNEKKENLRVWNGNFNCWKDVVLAFCGIEEKRLLKTKGIEVIYANYDLDGYEGAAYVVWHKGKHYYTLNATHCSCYGLEEAGWSPEKYTQKQLVGALEKSQYIPGLPDECKELLIKKVARDA